jgi:hypothetical protein
MKLLRVPKCSAWLSKYRQYLRKLSAVSWGYCVVDWKRVIDIVKSTGKNIVFSVECGTIEQAERKNSVRLMRQ